MKIVVVFAIVCVLSCKFLDCNYLPTIHTFFHLATSIPSEFKN